MNCGVTWKIRLESSFFSQTICAGVALLTWLFSNVSLANVSVIKEPYQYIVCVE